MPATPISAGGNAGNAVQVRELDGNSQIATTATDLITLTVTGPGGYTATYTSTAASGVATFNLSPNILAKSGNYTYVASLNSLSINASEVVNPGSPATVTATGGGAGGQSIVIGGSYVYPFSVLVTDQYGNPVPNVTVSYTVPGSGASGTLSSSTATTNASGAASVTGTANGSAGSYIVTATVTGLTPATFAVTNTKASPTVSISGLPATPIVYGSSVTTLGSTVSYSTGSPSGSVTFSNNSTALSPAVPLASGGGTYNASYLTAGGYSFTAAYSGDGNFSSTTSSALAYTVNKAPVTLTLPSAATINLNSSSTIPVTVTGQFAGAGILVPGSGGGSTVTYTFYNSSNTQIGSAFTATVAAGSTNSTASLVVPASVAGTVGTYSVTAAFNGDSNYLPSAGSTSGTIGNSVNLTFTVVAPDFFISVNKPALTIAQGQTAQLTFTFTPVGGFVGTVTFACHNLPSYATCVFTPPTLTATGNNQVQTTQLQMITLGSSSGIVSEVRAGSDKRIEAGLFFLPALLLGWLVAFRRKQLNSTGARLLILALMFAGSLSFMGCICATNVPVGTAVVTATATAAATSTGAATGTTKSAACSITITGVQ